MKLSKAKERLLREIAGREELYWDCMDCRYYFTGNPFRVISRTVDALYDLGLVTEIINSFGSNATVITPAGRSALAAAEGKEK